MADRKQSTVAGYLKGGKRLGGVAWTGGRGRRGPLGTWLLREKAAILEGKRAVPSLTWGEVATLAAGDGIVRKDGTPYRDFEVRKAWSDLAKAGLVQRPDDDAPNSGLQKRTAPTRTATTEMVSPSRGQGGIEGVSGDQPPTPVPPTTPVPVPPAGTKTGQALEQPRRTAASMPRVRRFGDED